MSVLREQRREETRRRLYQAALDAFRREDVATCRIDDIARAAGVSRGSFYFHYPTKDDVLLEYMRETELRIAGAIDALPAGTPFAQVLDTMTTELANIWQPDPRLMPEVVAVGLRFTATALTDPESGKLRNTMSERFCAAARGGELSTLLPPEILADMYLGHTVAGMLAWYGHQAASLKAVLQASNSLFFNGVLIDKCAPAPQLKKAPQVKLAQPVKATKQKPKKKQKATPKKKATAAKNSAKKR